MNPAFAHIDTWVFDLDNTLYATDAHVWELIGNRMTAFVERTTGLPTAEAAALQEHYLVEHGATVAGLVEHHGVDAQEFLDYVHDVDLSFVEPDPELASLLKALPGRRLVYTNGAHAYALRVLERLAITDAFEDVFALESAELFPKPSRESFDRLVARYRFDPTRALMVEDTHRNLAPAHTLGMKTVLIHPEPAATFPEHVHHTTDCLKRFLREQVLAGSAKLR
jgi:putative hydrolase of the HAD superfamily